MPLWNEDSRIRQLVDVQREQKRVTYRSQNSRVLVLCFHLKECKRLLFCSAQFDFLAFAFIKL